MGSRSSTLLRQAWWLSWRAIFVVAGVTYVVFSTWANELGRMGMKSNYPMETAEFYRQQAKVFPLKQTFRMVEAIHAIWLIQQGMDDYRPRAIVAIENALKTTPNSPYLNQYLRALKP